jgi:hypothetical protein
MSGRLPVAFGCVLVACLSLGREAFAQRLRFTLDFDGPESMGGESGTTAQFGLKSRLHTEGVAPGQPGVQAWRFGIEATGNCRIVFATTLATAGADVSQGGLRQGGFELTELTSGAGNEGAVSTVILSQRLGTTLDPGGSPHQVLGLELATRIPDGERCLDCTVRYRSGLVGSGEPVPVTVTFNGQQLEAFPVPKTLSVCGVPCFPPEPVPGLSQFETGEGVIGSSRTQRDIIELCSSSRGYGGQEDSLLTLARDTGSEFEISAEVVSVAGQAGVEARAFSGTGSDGRQAVIAIVVEQNAAGAFQVRSGVRSAYEGQLDARNLRPLPVQLPVRLGVRRAANSPMLTTFFFEGQRRVDQLSIDVRRTGLDVPVYRTGLVHGSDPFAQAHPRFGVARFRGLTIEEQRSVSPPVLARAVVNFHGTTDRPTVLAITGSGLEEAIDVQAAGLKGEILDRTANLLKVMIPPTRTPIRGDIVVRTRGGEAILPNSFFSYGEAFIRCDCNGDGKIDISDAVAILNHRFLGGPPCRCPEAEDCNDDDARDVSDPISLLAHLFLASGRLPPPPFPDPGVDPRAPVCGLDLPLIRAISTDTIRPGERFTIQGEGFSRLPEENIVLLGDAQLRVIDSSPTRLTVEAGMIISGGSARLSLLRDFNPNIFADLLRACRPSTCSLTFIGPAVLADLPALRLIASDLRLIGTSKEDRNGLVIQLDPQQFDSTVPLNVEANVISPVIPGISPGARKVSFEHRFSRRLGPREAVAEIASRLERELSGDGPMPDLLITPDPGSLTIEVRPSDLLPFDIAGKISIYPGTIGRCGPMNLHPINDERAFGWCRFEELVKPCGGLPAFEWFIPDAFVTSKSGSLAALPHPNDRSPAQKSVMYNWAAYCHVRKHKLWNECKLRDLIAGGSSEIPDFPVSGWVLKTAWRTDDPSAPLCQRMPAGVDLGKYYSYVYSGDGRRWYLTAIHHTTKDLDKWFWFDAYMPDQVLQSCGFVRGIGGCGGTNLDIPASLAATIWKDHALCTNITETQPIVSGGFDGVGPGGGTNSAWCGNFQFSPECPDSIDGGGGADTCLNCHADASAFIPGAGSIKVDFLMSLRFPTPDPNPCGSGGGPVSFSTDVQPIFTASCGCHTGGSSPAGLSLAAGVAHGNLVNVDSCERPSMKRVLPMNPNSSWLWRKLNGTHNTVGACSCPSVSGCGGQMPLGGLPLSATQLSTIEQWINQGANP